MIQFFLAPLRLRESNQLFLCASAPLRDKTILVAWRVGLGAGWWVGLYRAEALRRGGNRFDLSTFGMFSLGCLA